MRKKKNETKPESFAHCTGKTASLFAFQAPKAGNKQQFLERDMLNTLPVGYGCAKRLCEIPHSVLEDTENDFLTICKLDMSLLSQSEMKCHHIKEQSAGFGINSASHTGSCVTGNSCGSTGWAFFRSNGMRHGC